MLSAVGIVPKGLVPGAAAAPAPGPSNNLDQELSFTSISVLACLIGVSVWNASEVILVTNLTYCRLRTLYFWSINASAVGVLVCTMTQIVNMWVTTASSLVLAISGSLGWVPLVTGQSLVLYSRLHLLYVDRRVLRLVLPMIIVDAITLHSASIVLIIGANCNSPGPFIYPYFIIERLQVTVFFIQEVLLSGIYLRYARKFLRKHAQQLDSKDKNARAVKRTLRYLVVTNIIILLLDVSVLVLQHLGLYIYQLHAKNFVYSVKLKLEIGVLSQLKDFVKRTRTFDSTGLAREEQRQRQLRQEEHIEVQWDAALRRAFGTISRSLAARTRARDSSVVGTREGQAAVVGRSKSVHVSHASVRRSEPEFFNVEMLLATSNEEQVCTPTRLDAVLDNKMESASTGGS